MPTREQEHSYKKCKHKESCSQFACKVWREGYQEGYQHGYMDGALAGYQAGYAEGFAKGVAAANADA